MSSPGKSRALDLLLITPPSRAAVYQGLAADLAAIEPPVWSGLIASHARLRGLSVELLDAEALGIDARETARLAAERGARLNVFAVYGQQPSASTQCMPAARETARRLAELAPEAVTAVLGTHASALPERTLREEPYTFVIEGEGPRTITALLECLGSSSPKPELVPGLWSRGEGGSPVRGPRAEKIRDLDSELPDQAWDLIDLSRYRAHNWHCLGVEGSRSPYASVQTSLGCPFRCSFCCIHAPFGGAGIRYWSPDHVVARLESLARAGVRHVKIPDEMFVLNPSHVLGICDGLIERKLDLNIWAYARIDTVDAKFLPRLRAAGFRWLVLGIESASRHVRDGVNKGRFGDDEIERVVGSIRAEGISVCANYIFGLPDDDRASMRRTLELAKRLNTEWANFYCAMAYPGSRLYEEAVRQGWPLPEDWSGYSQHSYDALPLPTDTLSGPEVLAFRDQAFREYYLGSDYLDLIERKFGGAAREDLIRMTARRLPRKHVPAPPSLA